MKYIDIPETKVQPGDLAFHKFRELDERPVAEVFPGGMISLDIFGQPTEAIPASNYDFRREVA